MAKQKKEKKAYKYLTEAEVKEIRQLSSEELLRSYLFQNKAVREIKKRKKEDSGLKTLKDEVKMHRETTVSDKVRAEMKELKDRKKELSMEIDQGIEDQLQEIKDINVDYREEMGPINEKLKLVQAVLDSRDGK